LCGCSGRSLRVARRAICCTCFVPAGEHLSDSGDLSNSSSAGILRIRPVSQFLSSSTPAASTTLSSFEWCRRRGQAGGSALRARPPARLPPPPILIRGLRPRTPYSLTRGTRLQSYSASASPATFARLTRSRSFALDLDPRTSAFAKATADHRGLRAKVVVPRPLTRPDFAKHPQASPKPASPA